ncbi:MAG: hypothetical protein H6744_10845 [Deltaproteobacteria bacterium]|nr:hypothetical protein [Deltaproteobacteria bacterium]MCB9787176.1 hypothetical protein [Deltaproteobacteria bacterium]
MRATRRWLVVAAAAALAGCTTGAEEAPGVDEGVLVDLAAFAAPPDDARPWLRWWWPGDDVEPEELRRELAAMAQAGFGGAELQAFDAALDPEVDEATLARRHGVDGERYFEHVRAAADAAEDVGLRLDLTLGSGWATGGPQVGPDDALQTLVWSERRLTGPTTADLVLDGPAEPPFYTLAGSVDDGGQPLVTWLPDEAHRVAVLAAPVTGGARSDDLFDLTDQVTLDPSELRDLGAAVSPDGTLRWEVPPGQWQLIAFYAMPDGEPVKLHATGGEARVVDHLDAAATARTLEHLLGARTGLADRYGQGIRGLFVDSFEFVAERLTTDDFAAEFEARRGYPLTPWLPAVVAPGADNNVFDGAGLPTASPFRLGPDDERVQYDYRLTVSELFVERFVAQVRADAAARGLTLRLQPHGIDVDLIEAGGAADLPETEQLYAGGTDLLLHMASSAAHLFGRQGASAEAMSWAGRDHMATPLRMKAVADKLLSAGITHIVFHGFPYRQDDGYGEPGWHPFSSPWSGLTTFGSNLGESNPFWRFLPALTRYVTRLQMALRLGQPEADLLVYTPWLGFPASFARVEDRDEPLFGGRLEPDEPPVPNALLDLVTLLLGSPEPGPRDRWYLETGALLDDLGAAGHGYDWVNATRLLSARVEDGRVAIGALRYQALLLPQLPSLPPEVAEHIAALARDGARVVVVGAPPERQPGFHDPAGGDARVRQAMASLLVAERTVARPNAAGLHDALERAGVRPLFRALGDPPALRRITRRLGRSRTLTFLSNARRDPLETALTALEPCTTPAWLDPWTGEAVAAEPLPGGELLLDLPPFGATLLLCGQELELPAPAPLPAASLDAPMTPFTLTVTGADVPGGATTLAVPDLPDWREVEALARSASEGVYSTTVTLPADRTPARVLVELGRVDGVAELTWNDTPIASLLVPPFSADVTAAARPGANTLTVRLVPPALNRYVGLGEAGDPRYREFAKRKDRLAPVGLRGPLQVRYAAPAAD